MPEPATTEFRAHFDARVTFANGGGLTAESFRLDLPTGAETPEQIGELFVRHLGLAMVGSVELDGLQVVTRDRATSRSRPPARLDVSSISATSSTRAWSPTRACRLRSSARS
jgi:arylformamidase